MLGLAAGDTAGGAWKLGYSAITEQATVIAYDLIGHGRLDLDRVVETLREMDGSKDEQPVFRSETPQFRAWLNRASEGTPSPDDGPTLDPIGRSAILGVTYRKDPQSLATEIIKLNRIFHSDAESIMCGVIAGAAVAASCFGQAGRDLIKGIAEAVAPAVEQLADPALALVNLGRISGATKRVTDLISGYGVRSASDALGFVSDGGNPTPLDRTLASILLAAPSVEKPHEPVAEAVKIGGSNSGAAIGAMIGARTGIRAWPWAFANDTWFAEIGRRLVRGPYEVIDLPIPYAVEQHLISGVSGNGSGDDGEII